MVSGDELDEMDELWMDWLLEMDEMQLFGDAEWKRSKRETKRNGNGGIEQY